MGAKVVNKHDQNSYARAYTRQQNWREKKILKANRRKEPRVEKRQKERLHKAHQVKRQMPGRNKLKDTFLILFSTLSMQIRICTILVQCEWIIHSLRFTGLQTDILKSST